MSHIVFTTMICLRVLLSWVTCITFSTLYFYGTFQLCSTRWYHWFVFPPSAALASNYVLFKFYWLIIWCAAAVPAWLPGFSNPLLSVSVQWAWSRQGHRAGTHQAATVQMYSECTCVHFAALRGREERGSQNSHCTTWHDTYLVIIMRVGIMMSQLTDLH